MSSLGSLRLVSILTLRPNLSILLSTLLLHSNSSGVDSHQLTNLVWLDLRLRRMGNGIFGKMILRPIYKASLPLIRKRMFAWQTMNLKFSTTRQKLSKKNAVHFLKADGCHKLINLSTRMQTLTLPCSIRMAMLQPTIIQCSLSRCNLFLTYQPSVLQTAIHAFTNNLSKIVKASPQAKDFLP